MKSRQGFPREASEMNDSEEGLGGLNPEETVANLPGWRRLELSLAGSPSRP